MSPKARDAAIAAVLFTALIVLAVLQYRWIGQVSEADRERLQENLRVAVNRFSDDFNGEIERLVQVVTRGPSPDDTIETRTALWRDVAAHPDILKRIWDLSSPDLPPILRAFAARLPRTPDDFRPGPGRGGGGRSPASVEPNTPAIAIPRFPRDPATATQIDWLILELDRSYITGTWVPELIAKDFGSAYKVRVGSGLEPLADSARAPLFALRQGPFGRGRGEKGPPGENGRADKGPNGKGPPDFGPKQTRRGFGDGGPDNGWSVVATYQSGTMTQLVEGLRRRNLGISFGILLLMGVSIGLLMFSSRRATALAHQQMEFVAGVTHELRTPLAVIQSASQNLADGVAKGETQARRYGGVINDQAKRLGNMVEQVLRFAGLSSQHGELLRGPVEVESLIDEAVVDSEPELNASGSELTRDVPEGLPPVDGDKAALLHGLRNLLGNAAKHGQGSPVRLTAREAGGMIEIAVEDSGPGIDPADLPHVFEPFYRGKRAKEEQVTGSGLGLSLVKKIVEAHGGQVRVANHPGGGASFHVLLPTAKAD